MSSETDSNSGAPASPSPSGASDAESDKKGKLSTLPRLLKLMRPHRVRFYIATVALFLGSGIGLIYPQAAKYAINDGLSERNLTFLNQIALAFVALLFIQSILTWIRHYLMSWLGERVVADLRRTVFERLLMLPVGWFYERRTGEITGRLASDVTVVEGIVGSELSIALRNMVQLIGGIVLLFVTNARLTGLMLLVVPLLSVGVVYFGKIIRKMSKAVQDRLAEASAQVNESVSAIETVQAFVREENESARYVEGVEAAFGQAVSLTSWRATFMSSASFVGLLAVAGILWVGGRAVVARDIEGGDLAAFLLYTIMVAVSLGSLASLWGNLQRAAGATERLFEIVDTVPEIQDAPDAKPLPAGKGAVHFENVRFTYPSRPDQLVLDDVDLDVAPGEVVALVGTSGAGKSTLTSLLLRFFDVTSGAVKFEGIPVKDLRLSELRGNIAIVSQEPVLMSGTVRDNIAYGRLDATDEEIEIASKDAHADAFIRNFPDGYDTIVGERGVKLSGGQKQRVAIARALLKDPRVLVLDEATSNLDAESEALVQEALARLMKGRTTLVIAHRLSTVRDADRIVVLDSGKIVETGSHEALMEKEGAYLRLVEHQLVQEEPARAANG